MAGLVLLGQGPRFIDKARWGALAATNCMISKTAWQEAGRFDERYEAGGEDTALAGTLLQMGYDIVKEPLAAVHHAHGQPFWQRMKKLMATYRTVRGPVGYDESVVRRHSPHLDLNDLWPAA
jgi:GT2 family glycosyltransferase